MKSRVRYVLAGIAAAVLATLAVLYVISKMPCGIHPKPWVREASFIYTWLDAWSLDHDGELPARLEYLLTGDLGAEERFFKRVIEYPGAGKNLNSLDKDFVILLCRAGREDELEARVYADGRTIASEAE